MKISINLKDADSVYYTVLREVNRANPDMPYALRMALFESTLARVYKALNTKDGINVVIDTDSECAQVA